MGTSTNGQLTYGILLPEDEEYEWDNDWYNGEFDEWYVKKFRSFEAKGDNYWKEFFACLHENPMPLEIVCHCSCDYPMYILTLKNTQYVNRRGYPEEINPDDLVVSENDKQLLLDFVNENLSEHFEGEEIKIGWWLTSLWC